MELLVDAGRREKRKEGGGWEDIPSVNGPRDPREQEAEQAKTLTEKLLSKQRCSGRWITSTIVQEANLDPPIPEKSPLFPIHSDKK